jgi:hypothetical protein
MAKKKGTMIQGWFGLICSDADPELFCPEITPPWSVAAQDFAPRLLTAIDYLAIFRQIADPNRP